MSTDVDQGRFTIDDKAKDALHRLWVVTRFCLWTFGLFCLCVIAAGLFGIWNIVT